MAPNEHEFHESEIEIPGPPGLIRPQTVRFSAVGSCQAEDSIPSRSGELLQPLPMGYGLQGNCSATD